MINSRKKYNPNLPYTPNPPHRFLLIGNSGSDKINALLNLIKLQRPDVDKTYLYVKGLFESKNKLLIKK